MPQACEPLRQIARIYCGGIMDGPVLDWLSRRGWTETRGEIREPAGKSWGDTSTLERQLVMFLIQEWDYA